MLVMHVLAGGIASVSAFPHLWRLLIPALLDRRVTGNKVPCFGDEAPWFFMTFGAKKGLIQHMGLSHHEDW